MSEIILAVLIAIVFTVWCITCEAQPCECGGQYD